MVLAENATESIDGQGAEQPSKDVCQCEWITALHNKQTCSFLLWACDASEGFGEGDDAGEGGGHAQKGKDAA